MKLIKKYNLTIRTILLFVLTIIINFNSQIIHAQIISKPITISIDTLKIQEVASDVKDSLISPLELQPLEPKPCTVTLGRAIAYIANPVDLNPDRYIFDIPSQYYGKIEKVGNDYEIYFPKKVYIGHYFTLGVPPGLGSIFNYHFSYGRVPIDTLKKYNVWLTKSEYDYCYCYIEVKQPNGKVLTGIIHSGNQIVYSNMSWPEVDIGDFYDVNIYSFDNSGQNLEQSFKVFLKYCSVTDSNECP